MTISPTASCHQNLHSLPLKQDEQPQRPIGQDGLADWIAPTSVAGIVTYILSKITTSDVAQVGDLMVNGRENAVYAERPPVRK